MDNFPSHLTQVNVEILRKGVEVATTEVAEAEKIYHAAAEVKRAINKIPKGKAGGGKGAKRAANKTYTEARKDVNQKTIDLENAKRKLENAEQALDGISFTHATMDGDDSGLPLGTLRANSSNKPLQSPCNSDKTNDLGSARIEVERQEPRMNVVSESRHSGVNPHMHRQHLSEELPCQQPVSEGNSSSGEPSDGSKEQSKGDSSAGVRIKRQEHQVNAVSESRVSGQNLLEENHQTVSNRNLSLDESSDGSKEQDNDLEKEAGVERHFGPCNGHQSHETSSNQTPPEAVSAGSAKPFDNPGEPNHTAKQVEIEKDYEKDLRVSGSQGGSEEQDVETLSNPEKNHGPVTRTASQVNRSTSKKKLELAGESAEAQGAVSLHPITDEDEEDGWVVFLSDPALDTDGEEKDRVAEAIKLKHPALTAEEKGMYRYMEKDQKKEYEKKARTAINLYLQEDKQIDAGIRRMARLDPEFLPEAATTSRGLALHFLTSREGNIMCGYHAFKNKASFIRDGWGKPGMKVRGVPGRRKVGTSAQHIAKGLGSCGCMIQDILLEFALSKQISISGFVSGDQQSEMMSFHDYMEPRIRSFAFQAILLMVPDLSLNDFYTHGDALNHKVRVAKKRAHYWMKTVNDKFQVAASLEVGEEHELESTELTGSEG